ncbi:hypothetical protein EKL37_07000, partial [Pseudomonas aeruginosa]
MAGVGDRLASGMLAYVADPERMARFYEQALGLEGLRGRVEGSPAGAAGRAPPRGGAGRRGPFSAFPPRALWGRQPRAGRKALPTRRGF